MNHDAYDPAEYEMMLAVIKATPGITAEAAEAEALRLARHAHAHRAANKPAAATGEITRHRRCACGWAGEVHIDFNVEVVTPGFHNCWWVCDDCGENYSDRVRVTKAEAAA